MINTKGYQKMRMFILLVFGHFFRGGNHQESSQLFKLNHSIWRADVCFRLYL